MLFYLIGVEHEYQNKGVTAVIFNEYHKTFTEKGIQNCFRTPELSDNIGIAFHFYRITQKKILACVLSQTRILIN